MSSAALAFSTRVPQGASFIYQPTLAEPIHTPEQLTEEQRRFFETAQAFVAREVIPRLAAIEAKEEGVVPDLLRRAAELGLMMVSIPEAYGGLGLDKTTAVLIAEAVAAVGSFAVSYGAHTGIGSLPLVYYGTEDQKRRYLPRLASGELLAAYALSEPGSGSDALAAKTTARLTPDGRHYVLSGTKQWITNAGFADLFTVFAQVGGDQLTAFLVERAFPGVSIGREEHKLGIRGSSTCQLILEDVKVPVENLLGEVGRGHKIAFNILNIGRINLGVGSLGAARFALSEAVRYAKERRQFKKPIATFGLIRQKLAEAATLMYACESMAYRVTGAIDQRTAELPPTSRTWGKDAIGIVEDLTIEASALKVFGSEALWHIADQMLQIFGGNGFVEDYPLERVLRDARVNRIFEGTNEINRLIIPATLLKRAVTGRVPVMSFAIAVLEELKNPELLPAPGHGPLAVEAWATDLAKRAVVYAASYAAQKYVEDLKEKQHLLGALADCIIDIYGMDSVVARARQAIQAKVPGTEMHGDLATLYCFEARANIFQRLRRVAMMMADGPELDLLEQSLDKLDRTYRVDFMGVQDRVATHVIEHDGYGL